MKKITLTALLIIGATATLLAQKNSSKFNIGFTLSPVLSSPKIVENGISRDASKFGFNYGLMVDYAFADRYYLSTGIHVSTQGGTLIYKGNIWDAKHVGTIIADNSSTNNMATYKISSQYIEFPFAIKLKTDSKSSTQFWGSFGGFLGFLVKSRADITSNITVNGVANYSKDNENIIGDIQPINTGMQLGAGVELPLGDKNRLVAGLIFNNGLIDMTRNSKWGNDGRINLNNFSLKLGVFF